MAGKCGRNSFNLNRRADSGFTLIETLVALAVLGIIAVFIMGGMIMASKSVIIGNEQTTAESFARSQLEYIQSQPYDSVNNPPLYDSIAIPSDINGYALMTPFATRINSAGNPISSDSGLQKITVTVKRNEEAVFTLEGYKVK